MKASEDDLKEVVNRLKRHIRNLLSENRKLKSEIKTLRRAWKETEEYLIETSFEKTLEELLDDRNKK